MSTQKKSEISWASKKHKKVTEEFIAKINSRQFTKRTLPNASINYPTNEAVQSFKEDVHSKEFKEMVKSAYQTK
ncbi:hypothetical protein [Leptospira idonii]|uniref:Uncharacterized protein n=1 Tax=Leptospira idonii TaxID=1193500 RepID=A0A4R9M4E3_9LEPT|nr:hypothetical protein [Leptospira idonii]TGN20952.1 hypothetical protein EHS15_00060 [Leptospira idonii]